MSAQLQVEDFNSLDAKKKGKEDSKDDPNNATNFPDDKSKASKVSPDDPKKPGAIEAEEDNL